MTKQRYVLLSDYIKSGHDINDVMADLKAENITAQGKFRNEQTEVDIENGVISVDSETGEYNPPPVNIQKEVWYTYKYDPESNILREQHEAGTIVGFSSLWDIEVLIDIEEITKKTRAPRKKGDPEWWQAAQRYVSYIHHYRKDFNIPDDFKLSSKFLWDLLKSIKNHSSSLEWLEDTVQYNNVSDLKIKITQELCDDVDDLTEIIQAIEPKLRENKNGELISVGDDVLKYRPKTDKTKDSITFEHFETKVNLYLKEPESFFTKTDLKKLSPERGKDQED